MLKELPRTNGHSVESKPGKIKKVSLIISRGSLDGVYPGLIMANGARAEGIEASLFFTFFGLAALHKQLQAHLQVSTVGNAAMNMAMPLLGMPITIPFPTVMGAIPGVSAFASYVMMKRMEKLDIPSVGEFLEMIHDTGAEIYACKAAMDMFGIKKEELVPQVTAILTVGDFYEKSAGAQIIFT
ncbi:MAG: DsrE/DsrF/DrsH-like family protein [Anaerolineales bacterium]